MNSTPLQDLLLQPQPDNIVDDQPGWLLGQVRSGSTGLSWSLHVVPVARTSKGLHPGLVAVPRVRRAWDHTAGGFLKDSQGSWLMDARPKTSLRDVVEAQRAWHSKLDLKDESRVAGLWRVHPWLFCLRDAALPVAMLRLDSPLTPLRRAAIRVETLAGGGKVAGLPLRKPLKATPCPAVVDYYLRQRGTRRARVNTIAWMHGQRTELEKDAKLHGYAPPPPIYYRLDRDPEARKWLSKQAQAWKARQNDVHLKPFVIADIGVTVEPSNPLDLADWVRSWTVLMLLRVLMQWDGEHYFHCVENGSYHELLKGTADWPFFVIERLSGRHDYRFAPTERAALGVQGGRVLLTGPPPAFPPEWAAALEE